MNSTFHRINFFQGRHLAWLAVLCAAVAPGTAAPLVPAGDLPARADANSTQAAPRSVFIQPANLQDGRDPFFPTSVRPYVTVAAAVPNAPTTDLSSIVMQGISGSPDHRLVIINKVTFAAGDEAEVLTSQGHIRIRCLFITDDSAVIEAAGQRQILHYKSAP
jgi:hypothetical protein